MVDRGERNWLIGELRKVLAGEESIAKLAIKSHSIKRDKSIHNLLDDYEHTYGCMKLPCRSRGDAPDDLTEERIAVIERMILFLETDRKYVDPDGEWDMLGVCLTGALAVGGIGVLCSILNGFLHLNISRFALNVMIFGGFGVYIGFLFIVYVISIFLSGIHIFRVRILRQNCSPTDEQIADDAWPFRSIDEINKTSIEPT